MRRICAYCGEVIKEGEPYTIVDNKFFHLEHYQKWLEERFYHEFTEFELEKLNTTILRTANLLKEIEDLEKEIRFLRLEEVYLLLHEGYNKIKNALELLQKIKEAG